jgi:ferric-dicitrate binding protein FerR (iron transport regulator)
MDKFREITGKYNKEVQPDVDAAWNRFQQRLSQEVKSEPKTQTKVISIWKKPLSWAAVLLALVGSLFIIQNLDSKSTDKIQIVTSDNEIQEISLPDGSTVWLNENSSLEYPSIFNENSRSVQLTGEAFFDVAKNPSAPFTVQTPKIKVEVLGTSFNVDSHSEADKIEVEVASGKVKVQPNSSDKYVELLKGDKAVFDLLQKSLARLTGKATNTGGWKDKTLVFRDVEMAEILKEVSKLYNVEFEFKDSAIIHCSFDTDFHNEDLSTILKTFEVAFGCEIKTTGKSDYKVVGGNCK